MDIVWHQNECSAFKIIIIATHEKEQLSQVLTMGKYLNIENNKIGEMMEGSTISRQVRVSRDLLL